ncbi:MAG: hypothetical protein QXS32_09125 [Candidatus Nezhaarchaeales archaeon]
MLSFEVRRYEREGRCILCNSHWEITKCVNWSDELGSFQIPLMSLHVCGTCYNDLLKKFVESLKRAPYQDSEFFTEVLTGLGVSVEPDLVIELWRDAVKAMFKGTPIAMSIEKLERYEACESIAEFKCPSLPELSKLLTEKKLRAGVPENRLLFVGMADAAKYRWCPLQSFLSNAGMELLYFTSYLVDKVAYSIYFNQLQEFPQDLNKFLDIGEELKFSDVEKILKDIGLAQTVENKIQKLLIKHVKHGSITQVKRDHKSAGEVDELLYAEPYPTIRWNFKFKDFIVVGFPDGITEEFVYEFKSTRKESYIKNVLPVAQAQADLYGYFFKRRKKRVQVRVRETGKIETWESNVDTKEAEHVLNGLARVVEGEILLPSENERKWKCKVCEFKDECRRRVRRGPELFHFL